jgi:hypothetical protein
VRLATRSHPVGAVPAAQAVEPAVNRQDVDRLAMAAEIPLQPHGVENGPATARETARVHIRATRREVAQVVPFQIPEMAHRGSKGQTKLAVVARGGRVDALRDPARQLGRPVIPQLLVGHGQADDRPGWCVGDRGGDGGGVRHCGYVLCLFDSGKLDFLFSRERPVDRSGYVSRQRHRPRSDLRWHERSLPAPSHATSPRFMTVTP